MVRLFLCFLVFSLVPPYGLCQTAGSTFSEDFDSVTAPDLPAGWSASGFAVSASAARSAPNAVAATGNMGTREIRSPLLDLGGGQPAELSFHERRSTTAAQYRLEVSISDDGFASLLFQKTFDAIGVVSSYVKRTVDLSAIDPHAAAEIHIRWRILPDSTNSTGVLRIDDVVLTLRVAEDLAVDRVLLAPLPVTSRDTVAVSAFLRNAGVLPVTDYEVEFFLEREEDRLLTPQERFAALTGPPLGAGDSAVVQAVSAPPDQGSYTIIVAVSHVRDGNRTNDTASAELRVGAPARSILINEIMYAPAGDEPEWIEVLNVTADTIDLSGWAVSDHGLSRKGLVGIAEPVLAPGQYGIVARDESFLTMHPSVPGPFFTAEFSALNNTSADGPILFSDQNVTIDSVHYDPSWGGQSGHSLERIDTEHASVDPSIWTTCVDSLGSTPGKENSTARLEYDLVLASIRAMPGEGDALQLDITVVNNGKRVVREHDVLVFDDLDFDRRADESELFAWLNGRDPLSSDDSVHHTCTFSPGFPGEHLVIARIRTDVDQRPENDQGYAVVMTRHAPGALIVNEVMYEPLEGLCEWVELYNPGGVDVDLHGWVLSDAATPSGSVNRFLIAGSLPRVRPDEFVVVAADSTILGYPFYLSPDTDGASIVVAGRPFGFGNDGDAVIVKDAAGYTVDSLAYDPQMHHPHVQDVRGRSLERIRMDGPTNDRLNWSTASGLPGGSPGRRNTIAATVVPSTSMISVQPNPFSPDGDGWEDFCVIVVELPYPTASIRARVFDTRGRMVRTLASAEHVGARSQIIWDGLDDRQGRVPVGPYVVLLEVTKPLAGGSLIHKVVVVVGMKL